MSKLKRFMTDEELEHFNKLREVDNRMAAAYMASLDLFEPTDLTLGLEEQEDRDNDSNIQ